MRSSKPLEFEILISDINFKFWQKDKSKFVARVSEITISGVVFTNDIWTIPHLQFKLWLRFRVKKIMKPYSHEHSSLLFGEYQFKENFKSKETFPLLRSKVTLFKNDFWIWPQIHVQRVLLWRPNSIHFVEKNFFALLFFFCFVFF